MLFSFLHGQKNMELMEPDLAARKKKCRGRPRSIKQASSKRAQEKNDNKNKTNIELLRGNNINSKTIGSVTKHNQQNNNQSKVQKSPQAIREKKDGQSSDDDELADFSEKANRIEGAGGNDFHYFCRICKFAVFRRIKMLGNNKRCSLNHTLILILFVTNTFRSD